MSCGPPKDRGRGCMWLMERRKLLEICCMKTIQKQVYMKSGKKELRDVPHLTHASKTALVAAK